MPRLIVNADDFGLTPGINRSVAELFRAQALSSATLMSGAPHALAAAEMARENPGLGVGCHVVLVDGTPMGADAPSLSPTGGAGFYRTLNQFYRAAMRGSIREQDIEREAVAQIRALQDMGVPVDHVDTHKHTHMLPPVLRPLLRAAAACGIRTIRNPFEPPWSARRTRHGGLLRGLQVGALRARFHRHFLHEAAVHGFVTTDGSIGVLATGVLTEKILSRLLHDLPEGTWELVCHPGYADSELRAASTRLVESRGVEHAALAAIVPKYAHRLTDFRHLLQSA